MSRAGFKVLMLAVSGAFHTERFVAELKRQGCRVLLASLEPGTIHHFHLKCRGPHRVIHYTLAAMQIRGLIRRFRPDVINPHYAAGYGYATALASRGVTIPIVLNLWGGDVLLAPHISPIHRLKPVLGLKAADCIIGDSRYLVESAVRLVPKRCTRVIPWGVEERYLALHRKDYKFSRPLRIIVPRRQEKLYNNPFIVEALADLLREGRIEVTFQGYGELADEFRRRAEHVTDRGVRYYDRMSRAEFLPFVAQHDVYLSAASTDSSPVSLIEAMALGLIPIAADVPGVREWLNPDTGFLYRQHDAVQLKGIVSDLLQKRDPLEQMRRKNFEKVQREAVFERNIAEQLGLMRELASRRQR